MGTITEEGLKKHIGVYAELCTIPKNTEDSGKYEGDISYRPGIGFYVGNNSVEDGDVIILKPYMGPGWRREHGPGVSFFRAAFLSEGLLLQEGG